MDWYQGLVSISNKMSYCKILQSLGATRFVFRIVQSLWNLTGTADNMPVKFERDTTIQSTNLVTSRLHKILR